MDMALTSKELFLILAVPKKLTKFLQTTSCGIVNKIIIV